MAVGYKTHAIYVVKHSLFLSKDSGNQFEKVSVVFPVTGVSFDHSGEWLIGGPQAIIHKNTTVTLPSLDQDDAVQYLTENPVNMKEIIVSTYKKNVFISTDSGTTWTQIVKSGCCMKTINEQGLNFG